MAQRGACIHAIAHQSERLESIEVEMRRETSTDVEVQRFVRMDRSRRLGWVQMTELIQGGSGHRGIWYRLPSLRPIGQLWLVSALIDCQPVARNGVARSLALAHVNERGALQLGDG